MEIRPDKRATVFSHLAIRYGVPLGLVSVFLFGWAVIRFFTAGTHAKKQPEAPAVQSAPVVSPAPAKPGGTERPGYVVPPPPSFTSPPDVQPPKVYPHSKRWRISGLVTLNGKTAVYIEWGRYSRKLRDTLDCPPFVRLAGNNVDLGGHVARLSFKLDRPYVRLIDGFLTLQQCDALDSCG